MYRKARFYTTLLYAGLLLGILKTNQRQMRSSGLVQYSVKRTWTGFGDRSFSSCAPLLWNSLPQRLKQSQNVDIFKKRLKMWLFNDHFGGVALWSVFGKALYIWPCIFIIIITKPFISAKHVHVQNLKFLTAEKIRFKKNQTFSWSAW
jgi:hypothetical protein